jgi:hypothetical protein
MLFLQNHNSYFIPHESKRGITLLDILFEKIRQENVDVFLSFDNVILTLFEENTRSHSNTLFDDKALLHNSLSGNYIYFERALRAW